MPALTIASPTFHPEPIGTPVYATDAARWFADRGWEVQVVTGQPFYPRFERFEGYGRRRRHDVLDGRIPVLRLPTVVPRGGRTSLRAVGDVNFAVQGLLRARRRRTPAVLSISPGVPYVAAVGRALTARHGRHVALVHDIQSGLAGSLGMLPEVAGGAIARTERLCLERADHVTALTGEMVEELHRLGVRRPMSVTPLWATVPFDPALVGDEPVSVQYSGNFGQKQGVDSLVDIAAALHRRAPGIELLLRGAGPRFEQLQASMTGVAAITFEAPVDDVDLPRALARSAIHLVLLAPGSGRFAVPSKVVNTLAVGSLVVAMADDGSPLHRLGAELDGITVVPVGDVDAVVDAVTVLAEAPDLRARRLASQAQAAEVFDRDAVLEKLEALLRQ